MRWVVIATRVEPFPEGLRVFGPYTFTERAEEVRQQINERLGRYGWLSSVEPLISGHDKAIHDFTIPPTDQGSK